MHLLKKVNFFALFFKRYLCRYQTCPLAGSWIKGEQTIIVARDLFNISGDQRSATRRRCCTDGIATVTI